jgi:hypothetical protein
LINIFGGHEILGIVVWASSRGPDAGRDDAVGPDWRLRSALNPTELSI